MVFNAKYVLNPMNKGKKKRKPDEIIQYAVSMYGWELDLFDKAIEICKRKRVDSKKNSIVPGLIVRWSREIINAEKGEGNAKHEQPDSDSPDSQG
jgi:hypothetical protein